MSKQIIFRPHHEYVTLNPLQPLEELRYILHTTEHIPKGEITIKYAFPNSWQENSPEIKLKARDLLIAVLDIGDFEIEYHKETIEIVVPTRKIKDESIFNELNPFEIQLVVKLQRVNDHQSLQFKTKQILLLETLSEQTNWSDNEASSVFLEPEFEFVGDVFYNNDKEQQEDKAYQVPYGGIISIDFGTTNSVIIVRDPHFAAEEISKNLSRDQWSSLTKWIDEWLIEHFSMLTPRKSDIFLENLTKCVPGMNIPPCGSLSIDIWQELGNIDQEVHKDYLSEVINSLSGLNGDNSDNILEDISHELFNGLERVIYSKTLESQRYFILELDSNAGAKPISSTVQIIAAPQDENKIHNETEIEMGVRVNLLMRSATLGDADIRQFALSIKRYFGRNEFIELVPSETASVATKFDCDTLCLLAYKKLLERAINDIKKNAKKGKFEYADIPHTIVATFPTTYPASLRRKLRDLLYELNISNIDTRFDEGSASLIYYVWREVCADPVCGMEGLMSRCRVDRHNRPYQNILLYDLGGGTTDIALIQLIYEEIPIFEPTDKTGTSGGSYFRITPRLLGSTGHSFIGGDLITLWLFRLIKTKLADKILSFISQNNIDPPPGTPISGALANLPSQLVNKQSGNYLPGSLLDWTYTPQENIRQYDVLNDSIINVAVPTKYKNHPENTSRFFTLWHLTEDTKKILGTPLTTYSGSGLGQEWPEKSSLDNVLIFNLVVNMHPWLENYALVPDNLAITITQKELCKFAKEPVSDSLHLAMNLAKARLRVVNVEDKIDRLILSGLSCNLQIVQEEIQNIFRESEGLFNFNLANVFFDQELAKTSVAMGACIGRYLESVRIDPTNDKTRQMLREGYDQIELVVENLFTHLACRLVYDSLVAMVIMFDYGQKLDKHSYFDRKPVARSSMDSLRPVQEKFWIYRVDFEGANPLYLGLIDAEGIAIDYNFSDFRKFREHYLVGFEADAELFVRGFFIPRGPKNIIAQSFIHPSTESNLIKEIISINSQGYPELIHTISSQEIFQRKSILKQRMPMIDTIEYPDGSRQKCIISEPLSVREMYDFYIEGLQSGEKEPPLIGHFHLTENDIDEVYLACDERGKIVLLYSFKYDIKIWADIDYVPQKIDSQYDPFCGQH